MVRITSLRTLRHAFLAVLIATPLLVSSTALAVGAISQGFTTSDSVVTGSVVDLRSDSQNVVELANSSRADRLVGVVGNKSLVELGDTRQVQVVTSGLAQVLVSDINGTIKTGDRITASPISGIGMKATQSTTIVGAAQASMSNSSGSSQQKVTDKAGKNHTVTVASVPVQINVTYYVSSNDHLSPLVPAFLQSLGDSIAGHNVSALRVVIGFLALLLGFLTVSVILYAAVRSGLIAIGRNPLAQGALRKGLIEVVLTAVGILLLTVMVIYIILAV